VLTKLWGLRWWMMSLLMLGSIINYLTRATLAVAAPTVLKDLDITTQQYSWVLSAFQFAIMLQPLCGYVMDSVGLKRLHHRGIRTAALPADGRPRVLLQQLQVPLLLRLAR
jgi:MFS family permease